MFPYFDENPKQRVPYLTVVIIAVNVLVFFLLNFRPDFEDIVLRFGFIPQQFSFLTVFTSMFLHVNFLHLAGNMWFLWLFGDNIEDKIGSGWFLLFYLAGGLAAALLHMFLASPALAEIPCIGASGAISAVMGGYFVLFPKAKIRTLVFFYYMAKRISISAFVFFGIWFVLQFLYGLLTQAQAGLSQIAYGAHVGGFLFGVFAGLVMRNALFSADTFLVPQELKEKEDEKKFDQIINDAAQIKKDKVVELKKFDQEVVGYLKQGNIDKALTSYKLFESYCVPGALKEKYQLWIADSLYKRKAELLSLQAYLRFVSQYPDSSSAAAVYCKIGILCSKNFKNPAEGIEYLAKGLNKPEQIKDQELLTQAKAQMNKIGSALSATVFDRPGLGGQFCVLAQLFDETIWDVERINKVLRSIGTKEGQNLGMKLAYNAEYNLKKKDGFILAKVSKDEAIQAAELIQSTGIPVIAVSQEMFSDYPFIHNVTKAAFKERELSLTTDKGKSYSLSASDVDYVCLAQIPYFIYGSTVAGSPEDSFSGVCMSGGYLGTWNHFVQKGTHVRRVKDLDFNCILDIFTKSGLRLRINDFNFKYVRTDSPDTAKEELFSLFVEDIACFVGGDKIDEKAKLFISTSKWGGTYYRNIQELNHKGLWKAYLHMIYSKQI